MKAGMLPKYHTEPLHRTQNVSLSEDDRREGFRSSGQKWSGGDLDGSLHAYTPSQFINFNCEYKEVKVILMCEVTVCKLNSLCVLQTRVLQLCIVLLLSCLNFGTKYIYLSIQECDKLLKINVGPIIIQQFKFVFWVVTSCGLAGQCQCFRGAYCLHLQP